MNHHIGIVAVSPEGAALFYQRLARRASQVLPTDRQPRMTIHNEPLPLYLESIHRDDWLSVGRLLRKSADHLVRCGAELLVTPDNVVQHGVSLAEVGSVVPWLTMTDLVAQAVGADGRRLVGIIGTKLVTGSSTYQTFLGLRGVQLMPPEADDSKVLEGVIFGELIFGRLSEESRQFMRRLLDRFKFRGCDAVILALSEGGLLIEDVVSPLPVYDASAVLAEAVLARIASAGH
ncbi:MAG: aspartate/glutamate racemase family protein [Phycisphaerales bacterium]